MTDQWFVIVNPVSGVRKGLKAWKKLKVLMSRRGIPYESAVTQRTQESTALISSAIKAGYRNFICVGGDGTLHNMVNGIMTQNHVETTDVCLLMVSVGTGNDWIRNYGIPSNYDKILDLIKSGRSYIQDVGRVQYFDGGNPRVRYFHNFAGVGFDAYVVEKMQNIKQIGSLAYTFGLARSLFQYQVQQLKIQCNGKHFDEKMYMIMAGVGRYGGGGMKLTPNAEMNDGLFDVMMAKHFTIPEIIVNAPRLFNGSFIHHKKVEIIRTQTLTIEAVEHQDMVYLEADGELIGQGPFELSIVKEAIKVLIPPSV